MEINSVPVAPEQVSLALPSPTHRWRWGCSSRWCCRSRWWLCRCRSPRPRSPPPWFSALAGGCGTSSSRCGWSVRPSSTWSGAGGHLPPGTGAWWSCPASRTAGESLYQQSLGGLAKNRDRNSCYDFCQWHSTDSKPSHQSGHYTDCYREQKVLTKNHLQPGLKMSAATEGYSKTSSCTFAAHANPPLVLRHYCFSKISSIFLSQEGAQHTNFSGVFGKEIVVVLNLTPILKVKLVTGVVLTTKHCPTPPKCYNSVMLYVQ